MDLIGSMISEAVSNMTGSPAPMPEPMDTMGHPGYARYKVRHSYHRKHYGKSLTYSKCWEDFIRQQISIAEECAKYYGSANYMNPYGVVYTPDYRYAFSVITILIDYPLQERLGIEVEPAESIQDSNEGIVGAHVISKNGTSVIVCVDKDGLESYLPVRNDIDSSLRSPFVAMVKPADYPEDYLEAVKFQNSLDCDDNSVYFKNICPEFLFMTYILEKNGYDTENIRHDKQLWDIAVSMAYTCVGSRFTPFGMVASDYDITDYLRLSTILPDFILDLMDLKGCLVSCQGDVYVLDQVRHTVGYMVDSLKNIAPGLRSIGWFPRSYRHAVLYGKKVAENMYWTPAKFRHKVAMDGATELFGLDVMSDVADPLDRYITSGTGRMLYEHCRFFKRCLKDYMLSKGDSVGWKPKENPMTYRLVRNALLMAETNGQYCESSDMKNMVIEVFQNIETLRYQQAKYFTSACSTFPDLVGDSMKPQRGDYRPYAVYMSAYGDRLANMGSLTDILRGAYNSSCYKIAYPKNDMPMVGINDLMLMPAQDPYANMPITDKYPILTEEIKQKVNRYAASIGRSYRDVLKGWRIDMSKSVSRLRAETMQAHGGFASSQSYLEHEDIVPHILAKLMIDDAYDAQIERWEFMEEKVKQHPISETILSALTPGTVSMLTRINNAYPLMNVNNWLSVDTQYVDIHISVMDAMRFCGNTENSKYPKLFITNRNIQEEPNRDMYKYDIFNDDIPHLPMSDELATVIRIVYYLRESMILAPYVTDGVVASKDVVDTIDGYTRYLLGLNPDNAIGITRDILFKHAEENWNKEREHRDKYHNPHGGNCTVPLDEFYVSYFTQEQISEIMYDMKVRINNY